MKHYKKIFLLLGVSLIFFIGNTFADNSSAGITIGESGNTGAVISTGATSNYKQYLINLSDILSKSLKEQSAIAKQQRVDLAAAIKKDTDTRVQNWKDFYAKYEGGISKLFRKLTKTDRATVSTLIKTGRANIDNAEKAFNIAQKNKDVAAMSGALANIIQVNLDRFNSLLPYVATGSTDKFNVYISDMNATQSANKNIRIANTQKRLDLEKAVADEKKIFGPNTKADLLSKLALIPDLYLAQIKTIALGKIDASELRLQTSKSTSKDITLAQLEGIRAIIQGYTR